MHSIRTTSVRRLSRFFAALVILSACHAASVEAWQPPETTLPIWKATRDGNTLYLLGSVHLLRPEAHPLPDALYRAFDGAGVVAFELDLGRQEEVAAAMIQRGMYTDGRKLQDILPFDLLAELERRIGGMGIPFQAFEAMKPWFAGLALSGLLMQQAGYQADAGIDLHFYRRGRETGKRIIGLEQPEEQVNVFDDLDDAEQIILLRSMLNDFDTSIAHLDSLTAYWRRGAAEEVLALMTGPMADHPGLKERLFDRRHRNWVPRIEALLDEGEPAIVVVGMMHLVGAGSVIELLRERGFQVIQMTAPAPVSLSVRSSGRAPHQKVSPRFRHPSRYAPAARLP